SRFAAATPRAWLRIPPFRVGARLTPRFTRRGRVGDDAAHKLRWSACSRRRREGCSPRSRFLPGGSLLGHDYAATRDSLAHASARLCRTSIPSFGQNKFILRRLSRQVLS